MRRLVLILASAVLAALAVPMGCSSSPNTQPGLDASTTNTGLDASVAAVDAGVCDAPCGAACCPMGKKCGTGADGGLACVTCTPNCPTSAQCGDDGCRGTCGACTGATTCDNFHCQACATVICNGKCCPAGQICDSATQKCTGCTPDCTDKECGDNGCGGQCPPGCMTMQMCQAGKCVGCQVADGGAIYPDCRSYAQECGADVPTGCICGICSSEEACINGQCVYCSHALCFGACCLETEYCDYNSMTCKACQPQCAGRKCGPDGCGGTCAPGCAEKEKCNETAGTCSTCTNSCGTRKCGPDKDGCNCGVCTATNTSCIQGLCETCARPLCGGACCGVGQKCDGATNRCIRCEAQCGTAVCGDDGCGGRCGSCDPGTKCVSGSCQGCTPDCTGKDCGDDACNGKCGDAKQCDPQSTGNVCISNKCVACPNPEQKADICARVQATCGDVPIYDYCTLSGFTINCGDAATVCTGNTECSPLTFTCQTKCVAETDDAFCKRLGRDCGQASNLDNCGKTRFVDNCGTCTGTVCTAGKCT